MNKIHWRTKIVELIIIFGTAGLLILTLGLCELANVIYWTSQKEKN